MKSTTRKNDGYRPEAGASDAQLLAFVLFVGEGAHPWVGGLLGFPCLSLGPPAGAPNKDIDVVTEYLKKEWFSRYCPATQRKRVRIKRAPSTHTGDCVRTGPVVT